MTAAASAGVVQRVQVPAGAGPQAASSRRRWSARRVGHIGHSGELLMHWPLYQEDSSEPIFEQTALSRGTSVLVSANQRRRGGAHHIGGEAKQRAPATFVGLHRIVDR